MLRGDRFDGVRRTEWEQRVIDNERRLGLVTLLRARIGSRLDQVHFRQWLVERYQLVNRQQSDHASASLPCVRR